MFVDCFLTAYDPSDLPGASVDPLGFERGYLYLADRLLPGLTNVAAHPRYFGVLCAGVQLAAVGSAGTPREQYLARERSVLALERLWGLACALASEVDPSLPAEPVRGIRYVRAAMRELQDRRAQEATGRFKLLSRQAPYGVIGIYGAVGERIGFIHDRRTLELTPALGDRLAEAFLDETETPDRVRKAVQEGDRVGIPLDELAAWGERAHVSGAFGDAETRLLGEGYAMNPVRVRMGELLAEHPADEDEPELNRLARMGTTLRRTRADADLHELIGVVLAYEAAYKPVRFALDRVLWRCAGAGQISILSMTRDPGLRAVLASLPRTTAQLERALEQACAGAALLDRTRLDDTYRFVLELRDGADDPERFLRALLARHAAVQRGKFDRGRRKAPWVEETDGTLHLTLGQVPGLEREPEAAQSVPPHAYRTLAADAFPVRAWATVDPE